ncbi:MAG: hypothetical protein AAB445_00120 [Patescibacteria group bacterium]
MALPISTLVDLANAGVCVYLAMRLARAMHQDPGSRMVRYFFYTYSALTAAYFFLTVPRIFDSQNTDFLGYAFGIGVAFFLLANAFYGRVVLAYTFPRVTRWFFPGYLCLAALAVALLLVDLAAPIVDTSTGITNWNPSAGAGLYTATLFLLVLLPGAILFLWQGARAKANHIVRVRAYTIGIGSTFLAFSAVITFRTSTEIVAVLGDFFSIAGLLTIFLGVAYHRPTRLPPLNLQTVRPTSTPPYAL